MALIVTAALSNRLKPSIGRIELPPLEQSLNLSRRCHPRDYPTLGNFAPQPDRASI
jgi:hypothetical protein